MIIVDAHEDLAWNILSFGRDYTRSVTDTRRAETGSLTIGVTDDTLLGYPEYQRGQVAIVFATLFASPERFVPTEWDKISYVNPIEAANLYRAQMDIYHRLVDEHPDKFQIVYKYDDLQRILHIWKDIHYDDEMDKSGNPVGLVILMEGAECISDLAELENWRHAGVRIIAPAWAGNRFCGGTGEPGPLTADGIALLEHLAEFGFTLDVSHMDEKALLQALDIFPLQIIASHSNALGLLKGSESNRHLSDRAIRGIIERDGIIGIVPFNSFLKTGWKRGDQREEVSLADVVAQIDYICQITGDVYHVGIGTDFDGGFGLQSVPPEIDSIADIQALTPRLMEIGYTMDDIELIMSKNWIRMLTNSLPD